MTYEMVVHVSAKCMGSRICLFANRQWEYTIAIDGDNMVIGASGDDFNQGAAITYRRAQDGLGNPVWQANRKLVLSDQESAGHFGFSLALSDSQLVVSAPKAMSDEVRAGKIHFFEYHPSGNWLQQGQVSSPMPMELGGFGQALELSGSLLLISQMPHLDLEEESSVFRYDLDADAGWSFTEAYFAPPAFEGTRFGMDLSIDGQQFIVGAPGSELGSVYLFERSID